MGAGIRTGPPTHAPLEYAMTTTFNDRRLAVTDRRADRASIKASAQPVVVSQAGEGVRWQSIFAGALTGFAVTIIMTTLGAAIGLTAAADSGDASNSAMGIGAGVWWLLTVIAAGFLSGRVVSATAPHDQNYSPVVYGTLAWITGVLVMLVLLAIGVGSLMGGLGGGLGAAASRSGLPNVNGADSARAVQTAATVGLGAAWGLLLSQLLALLSTILGARPGSGRHRASERHAPAR
jgi:hypothetical protein